MKNIINKLPSQDYRNNNRLIASGVSRRSFEFIAYTTGDNPHDQHYNRKPDPANAPTITIKRIPAHRSPTLSN